MKSFRKTFTELEKTIKRLFSTAFFITVLCGGLSAQSTVFLEDTLTTPRLTPELPVVHGFGAARLSSFYPDTSFRKAYSHAVEDLKASLLTSVYMEAIRARILARNNEFGIGDSMLTGRIAKVDSSHTDHFAYFLLTLKDSLLPGQPLITDSGSEVIPPLPEGWMDETFSPVETENSWLSAGRERFSEYAPYNSWARSKLDALSNLSYVLNSRVESSTKSTSFSTSRLTYVSSKTIFRNIVVLRRVEKDGYCYTLLSVQKEDIVLLN